MENTCQNCNHDIIENFCANCGQKKYKRIDKKYLWDEVQYTFLHLNKGFLYSAKSIIKNPGKTAREFIEGNRVNHYKPISMAFVLSGISAFLSFKVVKLNEITKQVYINAKQNSALMNDFSDLNSHYSSFILLGLLPLVALFTKLVFRKWGNNYYEHVVMNAFGLSCYTIVTILFMFPILFVVRNDVNLYSRISFFSLALIPLIMVWFYKGFYNDKKLKIIIWKVFKIALFGSVCFFSLIIISTFVYMAIKGPEGLKYLQPK